MLSESQQRLLDDIHSILEALRQKGNGTWACVLDLRNGLLVETPEPDAAHEVLGRFLEQRREQLFELPRSMEGEGPPEDLFAGWEEHAFLLAILNGRVAILVACPDPEGLRADAEEPLKHISDRLLRYDASWRIDKQGRGVFVGRPRLDVVVIGNAD